MEKLVDYWNIQVNKNLAPMIWNSCQDLSSYTGNHLAQARAMRSCDFEELYA